MTYSKTFRDGSARDEALRRRNVGVPKVMGTGPKPKPDTEQAAEQKANEKPGGGPNG
jgi:hypothetical protein